jgi:hypothetical protein
MGCKSRRRGQGRRWIFAISADKVKLSADLVDECILDEVELAASKDALNSDTKKPFNITNLTEVVELDKLLFKLLEILLVVRMIQDNDIVHVEEENDSVIHPKAWKALDRVEAKLAERFLKVDSPQAWSFL